MTDPIISIDQNCHPLWDPPAKLSALARAGYAGVHLVEDIDVAFTAVGAEVADNTLRLAPERFHRGGSQDWGAALFYVPFLGRQPLDVADILPATGQGKLSALARELGTDVDGLYDRWGAGDNLQLIGSSYVADKYHHRTLGDLTVAEVADALGRLLDFAREDCLRRFPSSDSRQRTAEWFDDQVGRVQAMIGDLSSATLTELYGRWMRSLLPADIEVRRASELFAPGCSPDGGAVFRAFTREYESAADAYDRAIEETDSPLRPLKRGAGELPFFAIVRHEGHQVRTSLRLDGKTLLVGNRPIALQDDPRAQADALAGAGVIALPGKALVMVTQVRLGPAGRCLALPYHGSAYMPTAHRLAQLLVEKDLLDAPPQPVLRVRFRLLDRLAELDTPIALPEYLASAMGCDQLPAGRLSAEYRSVMAEARQRLDRLADDAGRLAWQRDACADELDRIDQLDARRRKLASENPKDPELRRIHQQIKPLQSAVLERTVTQAVRDWQVSQLDFYDSRGAMECWGVALGGDSFYNHLLEQAEIQPE
jgi:hypothetical protein